MRAWAVLLLVGLAGCTGIPAGEPSGADSPADEGSTTIDGEGSTPIDGEGSTPIDGKGSATVDGTWRSISIDGGDSGAFVVVPLDVQRTVKEGRVQAVIDLEVLGGATVQEWGYQVLQRHAGTWVPLGFHYDGILVSGLWTDGIAAAETRPVPPGRRMFPLEMGSFANQEVLVYFARAGPDGNELPRSPADSYAISIGATGRLDLRVRVASADALDFKDGDTEFHLGLGCYPSYLQEKGWSRGIYDGCPVNGTATEEEVLPLHAAPQSGFRYGLRHEVTNADLAYDLTVGDVVVEDGSPVGHRAGTTTRHATYVMPPHFDSGWGADFGYLIDGNSAGRWEHSVQAYNTTHAGAGPNAGGPWPVFYLASDLVVGGPIWTCMGEGPGTGESRFVVDNAGSPATGNLDMLLYARADFGVPLGELLADPLWTPCGGVGPLYILQLVP